MKNGIFRFLCNLGFLIVCLFIVNFLFARLSPSEIRENTLLSAVLVAVLDGLIVFIFERIRKKN